MGIFYYICLVIDVAISQSRIKQKNFLNEEVWGGWWDSNPRHSEPQSDALTD